MKGFYYQRASTSIDAPWADKWPRKTGLPDTVVLVHNSAASPTRPTGTKIKCPKGWIDAGDYNKYIINSGFSTYMIGAMYEQYSTFFDTLHLNIPESSNNLPDILDEWYWNIQWVSSMQDPYDGGVYFKLTSPNFDGDIMPNQVTQARYVVSKTTASALDFAALMAQAARITNIHSDKFPEGTSEKYLNQALAAWNWARKNKNIAYNQAALTSPAISTGGYGDSNFTDEFLWAGQELYLTTKIDSFYTISGTLPSTVSIPGWQNVQALGCVSLANSRQGLTTIADTSKLKNSIINLAKTYKTKISSSPAKISLGDTEYWWGSNGMISTHAFILLNAYNLTLDSTYLDAAINNLDYVLGKNAVGYNFITGEGVVSPKNIHHRISTADGVADPIPGLLAGGPTMDAQSDCGSTAYPTGGVAKSYLDAQCSYSTNEIAINWNAPLAYSLLVLEAIKKGYKPVNLYNTDFKLAVGINDEVIENNTEYALTPNPVLNQLTFTRSGKMSENSVSILALDGTEITSFKWNNQSQIIDLSTLKNGMYLVKINDGLKTSVYKILKAEQ
ncbi:MAG: glycoside hydrolase family 9 protein [Cytophagales bacterium]